MDLPMEEIMKQIPLGRAGKPEEVAAAGGVPVLRIRRLHHPAGVLGERRNALNETRGGHRHGWAHRPRP